LILVELKLTEIRDDQRLRSVQFKRQERGDVVIFFSRNLCFQLKQLFGFYTSKSKTKTPPDEESFQTTKLLFTIGISNLQFPDI